tara:strand:- start:7 stop:210 length:204 start_codon:yes stop_codon:yes gene_type:complete
MEASDITIKAEDVQAAVNSNPAIDWALKEQALLRRINELESACNCGKNDVDEKEKPVFGEEKKDAKR